MPIRAISCCATLSRVPSDVRSSYALAPVGNLPQMFNRQGMPFYHDLIDKYGPVARLHGAYGVSRLRTVVTTGVC